MEVVFSVVAVGLILLVSVYLVDVADAAMSYSVSGVRGGVPPWRAPLVAAARLMLRRRTETERPDREAWALAPPLLGGLAAVAITAIPLSAGLAVADIPVGIVLFGAAMVQVMVAVFLHGWGPNSVFPMIGAFRMAAVGLSVGIPFSLVLITTALPAESLSVGVIIESQQDLWNVLRQPLGLPIYLATALGFSFWGPGRLPDGSDLAGGTDVESSGVALLVWRVSHSALLVAVSAMGAAAFLGGYLGPVLPGWLWMVAKTAGLALVLLWTGHRIARVRIEGMVRLGWLILLPLALVDVFVSGALTL